MSISQNFPEEGPTLNLNFAGSKVLDPRITFSRSSVGTYMDANGLVVTASADEPRFDHRYVNGEVESLGLLVEERRVNYALRSEEFSTSPNLPVNATLSSNAAIAPDGTQTADKLIEDNVTSQYKRVQQGGFTVTGDYTVSFFVKEAGRHRGYIQLLNTTNASVSFNLQNETVSGVVQSRSRIEKYPNGWYRISTSNTFNAGETPTVYIVMLDDSGASNYAGDGSSGIYIWGLQVEEGAFPTSYIPTTSSAATRVHDRAYYENVDQTDWFSKTEGTVVFEHTDVPYDSSTSTGWPAVGFGETAGGGSNPSIQYFITKNYGAAQYLVRRFHPNGDSAAIDVSGTGSAAPASKVGFVYKEDDYALVRNGSLVGTDTSGAVPAAYMLIFGMNGITATGNNWNAHLKNLQYYPTRLSNTVLQNLTK